MANMTEKKWLTTAAAAEIIGVRPATLERWRCEGRGPSYYKITARVVRYDIDDIDEWITAQRREPLATSTVAQFRAR
jgi:predicted DNA-binding transcriptional regulator AlpA